MVGEEGHQAEGRVASFVDREIRAAQERLARSIGQRVRWAHHHNAVDGALARLFPHTPIWEHRSPEFYRLHRSDRIIRTRTA